VPVAVVPEVAPPSPAGPADVRRSIGLGTLPVVAAGYVALLCGDAGGAGPRAAGVAALVGAAALVIAVTARFVPRVWVVGPSALPAALLGLAPGLAAGIAGTMLATGNRGPAAFAALLGPVLGAGLAVAAYTGWQTRGRLAGCAETVAAFAVVAPLAALAGALAAYVTDVLLALAVVPAHLLVVRAALARPTREL